MLHELLAELEIREGLGNGSWVKMLNSGIAEQLYGWVVLAIYNFYQKFMKTLCVKIHNKLSLGLYEPLESKLTQIGPL